MMNWKIKIYKSSNEEKQEYHIKRYYYLILNVFEMVMNHVSIHRLLQL